MNGMLVTMAVGDSYLAQWKRYCEADWLAYCRKHRLKLVLLTSPIDKTSLGNSRDLNWQKLVIGRVPAIRDCPRVAWVDSDVLINPDRAPDIFERVPVGKVGAVRTHVLLESPLFEETLQQLCGKFASVAEYNRSIYSRCQLSPTRPIQYMNTGVLAFHQVDLSNLEEVYRDYRPEAKSFQEQVPLSHHLAERDLWCDIDPRFNLEWYPFKYSVYSFATEPLTELTRFCLMQMYHMSYFLHFNGNQKDMEYYDPRLKQQGKTWRFSREGLVRLREQIDRLLLRAGAAAEGSAPADHSGGDTLAE